MTLGALALLAAAAFCGVARGDDDTPAPEACTDLAKWVDDQSQDCSWYSMQARCDTAAEGAFNLTAKVACCACDGGSKPYNPDAESRYITAIDKTNAENAKASADKWCKGGFKGELKSSRDEIAETMGGENMIVTILEAKDASGTDDDFLKKVQGEVRWAMIQKVVAFTLFILALIVWIFCCWSGCPPPFTCCRCCNKDRGDNLWPVKACTLFVIAAVFLGVGISMLGTRSAYGTIEDGANNLICSASKLLDTTLNGKGQRHEFIGVMPILQKFSDLDNQLSEGSPLLAELDDIMNETTQIEDSVRLVADTLKLMGNALKLPNNVKPMIPGAPDGTPLFHKCLLCEQLGPEVTKVAEAVETGVGTALFNARHEVKSQLSLSKRMDLQNTLSMATVGMVDLKDQLSGVLQDIVDPESDLVSMKDQVEWLVYISLLVIQILGILLVLLGCCVTCWFAAQPRIREEGRHEAAWPYNTKPSWCACSIWCCSHFLLMLVFILSGLLTLIVLPADGVCLLLQDLDGPLMNRVATGLNMTIAGDQGEIFTSLVDTCWAGKTAGSSNLLDLVFVREPNHTSGVDRKVYLREKLLETVQAPVEAAFSDIEKAKNASDMSLATNQDFLDLLDMIANSSVAATLLPDKGEMEAVPWDGAAGLVLDNARLVSGFATSSMCANFSLDGQPDLPGIEHFAQKLKEIQPTVISTKHACIEQVDCDSLSEGQPKEACKAGNKLMDLKLQLFEGAKASGGEEDIFRCDVFEFETAPDQAGTLCDPINMTEDSTGKWKGDCLKYHVTGYTFTEEMEQPCNLAEFNQYVKDFSQRLQKSVNRLDKVTKSTFDTITRRLRKLVDDYLIDMILEVSDGLTCGFMPPARQEVIDGLCYQAIAGLGTIANLYLVCGIFLVILALDMYFLFRFIQSNKAGQDQPGASKEAAGSLAISA